MIWKRKSRVATWRRSAARRSSSFLASSDLANAGWRAAQAATASSCCCCLSMMLPRASPASWPCALVWVLLSVLRVAATAMEPAGVLRGGVFDGADPLAVDLVAQLEAEVALVGHFTGGHGANGAARVAQHHDEIAGFDAALGDREEELGLVGLAVLVGAAHGEIAGVARPAEVVGLAAEFADGARRRVDQADVGELDGLDQHVLQAAIERRRRCSACPQSSRRRPRGPSVWSRSPWCAPGRGRPPVRWLPPLWSRR